jgi:hypothetical protein
MIDGHGLPPDPNCLHCVLTPQVQEHSRTHRDTHAATAQLLLLVAQHLAAYSLDIERDIHDARNTLRELARQAFVEIKRARSRP